MKTIRTVGFWTWVVIQFALCGILGAYLIYGPINLSDERIAIALGILIGLTMAAMWVWQGRLAAAGERARARRMAWTLGLAPWVIILPLALLFFGELRGQGYFPPPAGETRLQNFDRLWQAIDQRYPYFAEKGIDWQAARDQYRPLVAQAADDAGYHAVTAAMLAGLKDGHTEVESDLLWAPRFGNVEEIEGQAVIAITGPSAKAAGLQRGDILLTIEGQAIEERIAALPAQLRSGSTSWNARRSAFEHLLDVPASKKLAVTVRGMDGTDRAVMIIPAAQSGGQSASDPVVSGKRLDMGIGVIQVKQLWGSGDLVAEFDRVLDGMMEAPGIILDLRGNGGGSSLIADGIAGRFLSERFVYGTETYRRRLPMQAFRKTAAYRAVPRQPVYTGPLVVLIDSGDFSSAEMLIAALVDSGRAKTVGQTTGGGSGNPVVFHMTGGMTAKYSTGFFHRSNGALIEGVGIPPDVPVTRTVEAFRAGRDLEIETAVELIQGGE